ncbi:MAG: universal stress protein [Betaproteobacteria bacterium]|nr:universal stress protein [Betaproteobacteria bacterium]
MLKVVLAYDGSQQAKKAIDCLSWWPASSLNVVLVTALRGGPALDEAGSAVDCDPVERARAEETLGLLKQDLAKIGVAATAKVVAGDPRDIIVDVATQVSADLILTGSRGLNLAKRMLLGSVSSDVLQNAPCPVLLVR